MWITTTGGFYSAVQKDKNAPDVLTVRTRDYQSATTAADTLEMQFGEKVEIVTGEGTDYPYRFDVSRENFALWLASEARDYVRYSNFKDEVKASRGKNWANALMDVWSAMHAITDKEGQKHGYYATIFKGARGTR